jgi:hypothetical protein
VAFVVLELGGVEQVVPDHALQHLQHRRDQLRPRGQQQAQRDRQGQHPLPRWHVRDGSAPLLASVCAMKLAVCTRSCR